jgi:signal transduction histidine kinase
MTTYRLDQAARVRRGQELHLPPAAAELPPPLDIADMVAVIGHELAAPLSTISAAMELMESAQDQKPNALTATVRRQISRLLSLFDASLRAAEILGGRCIDRSATTSLPEVLARLQEEWPEQEQRLRIQARCEPGLPAAAIEERALEIVLNNLLMNAFKHSGGMNVTITAESRGDHVRVLVHDDGRGVPAHLRKRLFEVGRRGEGSGGAGLGLHVARQLVRAFGGELRLTDACAGAAFVLRLPVATETA